MMLGLIMIYTNLTIFIMGTFIEDYLQNPSHAILTAKSQLDQTNMNNQIDDDTIYSQIASGEFRLYEEMIFSRPIS